MAFDAGSVIGHYKLDSSQWTKGAQKVESSNKSMGKSMFLANVAFAAFQKTLTFVIDTVKDSVNAFIEQEKQEAQLEAVLKSTEHAAGLTKDAILDMASAFQSTTTFGDEAVLSAQNILLTFKEIGADVFPQATQTVLDMSQALGQDLKSSSIQLGKALNDPITGITALQRVGITFSDTQKEMIRTMQESGDIAGAQAIILAELESQFGGSAAAARETFGGALAALNNTFGDTQETIGSFIANAAKPFVINLDEMFTGVNTFLESAEGIEAITKIMTPLAGIASVASTVFTTLFELFTSFADTIGTKVNERFTELVGAGNEANVALQILAPVVQTIASGFAIVGEVTGVVVDNIFNMVDVIIQSAGVIEKFFEATAVPPFLKEESDRAWGAFFDQADRAGNAIGTFVGEGIDGVVDSIKVLLSEIDSFGDNTDQVFEDLKAAFGEGATFIEEMFLMMKESSDSLLLGVEETGQETEEIFENLSSLSEQWLEQQLQMSETEKETKIRHLREQADEYLRVAEDKAAVEEWLQTQIAELTEETQKEVSEKVRQTWSMTFDSLISEMNEAAIEFGIASEEYKLIWSDVIGMMEQKLAQAFGNFTMVLGQLSNMWNLYYNNQLRRLEIDYNKRREHIMNNVSDETERTRQLEELDEEYAEEQAAIKKEAWEKQKTADVLTSVINTALAVTRALAAGPIIGPILAGVIGGLGAAQTALIASQPVPQFQAGGIASPGLALVGEAGPELLNIGSTSRIFPAEETAELTGGVTQNITFTGDISSDVDIERSMQLAGASIEDRRVG
jgi:hypothetical protein